MGVQAIIREIIKTLTAEKRTIRRVFFTACGGSLAGIYPGMYLLDRESKTIDARLYNARELVLSPPMALDEETLVIACTLAGTTETLEALDFAKAHGAKTIGIFGQDYTYERSSVDYILRFKTIADITTPMIQTNVVVSLQLGFALLNEKEDYSYYDEAEQAYTLLETLAKEIRSYSQSRARKFAKQFAEADFLHVMASRASMGEAYAFVLCSLMEIQWINSSVLNSAEFFHGSFEVLDKKTPILQLIGLGEARLADERSTAFLQRMGENYFLLDVKELYIDILPPHVKEYFQHTAFDLALREFITQLAIERNHDKWARRYMWTLKY